MDTVRGVTRRGWTLHEMIISLGIMGIVLGLASHAATQQLRFFRGVEDIVALRRQVAHTTHIVSSVLWDASASDITVARDSALELHASIGTAVTCESVSGRITIPAASGASGNALAAFIESPEAGDRVMAFFEDSLGATWLALHVAAGPASVGSCAAFPSVVNTWVVTLQESLVVPTGTVLRFTRPLRLSLYHASDNRWYLGAKDWNGATLRFNTIQPVAGPLEPYSADPARSGLSLRYLDSEGLELPDPPDPNRIASVAIVARGETIRPARAAGLESGSSANYPDSSAATVGLRNRR